MPEFHDSRPGNYYLPGISEQVQIEAFALKRNRIGWDSKLFVRHVYDTWAEGL